MVFITALISEMQITFPMELNISKSTHDSVSMVKQHRKFSPKIYRKDSDNQKGEVHNSNRFISVRKHFRINLVVTNNMSTYKK